jgi:hypothetical protein
VTDEELDRILDEAVAEMGVSSDEAQRHYEACASELRAVIEAARTRARTLQAFHAALDEQKGIDAP